MGLMEEKIKATIVYCAGLYGDNGIRGLHRHHWTSCSNDNVNLGLRKRLPLLAQITTLLSFSSKCHLSQAAPDASSAVIKAVQNTCLHVLGKHGPSHDAVPAKFSF